MACHVVTDASAADVGEILFKIHIAALEDACAAAGASVGGVHAAAAAGKVTAVKIEGSKLVQTLNLESHH